MIYTIYVYARRVCVAVPPALTRSSRTVHHREPGSQGHFRRVNFSHTEGLFSPDRTAFQSSHARALLGRHTVSNYSLLTSARTKSFDAIVSDYIYTYTRQRSACLATIQFRDEFKWTFIVFVYTVLYRRVARYLTVTFLYTLVLDSFYKYTRVRYTQLLRPATEITYFSYFRYL